jgi:hypothetical protein
LLVIFNVRQGHSRYAHAYRAAGARYHDLTMWFYHAPRPQSDAHTQTSVDYSLPLFPRRRATIPSHSFGARIRKRQQPAATVRLVDGATMPALISTRATTASDARSLRWRSRVSARLRRGPWGNLSGDLSQWTYGLRKESTCAQAGPKEI